MKPLSISQPKRIVFGQSCLEQFKDDFISSGLKNILILTIPQIVPLLKRVVDNFKSSGIEVTIDESITSEPTFEMVHRILAAAKMPGVDAVAGIGGGSVLDTAKVVAAVLNSEQTLSQIIGNDKLNGRKIWLACLPTTSGTGSEVSPNALLFDESDHQKKAVISPYLVPDAAYVDPNLTLSVPSHITAATGFDAMIHCLEAYTNINAHPLVDLFALEGVRLVSENLQRAVINCRDIESRINLARASLYGGKCLGPVNTAAVHALAYPLANRFHITHGLSVAVLLPFVFEYNISANPKKHADVALALGAQAGSSDEETALYGVEKIKKLMTACGLSLKLADFISLNDLPSIAEDAIKIERLLNNNPRKMNKTDIIDIFQNALR